MSNTFPDVLAEVGREPLSMAAARQIRAAILSGRLADGTALPSEKDMAARLGIGRSTMREALRILQAQGLVTGGDTVSTKGPTVSGSGSLPSAATALEAVFMLGQVGLDDLVSLRLLIEQAGLRQAADAAGDPAALERAAAALRGMRDAADDVELFHAADVDFHAALIDAAGNRAYSLVMGVLREAMARHLLASLRQEPDAGGVLARLLAEHEAILAAVEEGDGVLAAELVHAHIAGYYEPHLQS